MLPTCDLHTHSVFSDGTYTPEQLIDEAIERGLSSVALCDHNAVDGLPRFLRAAEGKPIRAIAGAEFSVDYEGKELHLLGLFIPTSHFAAIASRMSAVNESKEESNRALIASLSAAGYPLDYDTVKRTSPTGKINRSHIARALSAAGYVSSPDEAFATLLSPEAGHYREPLRLTVWEMLDELHAMGAVPVLAHPLLQMNGQELSEFLPRARKRGLVGMEVYYSEYKASTTALALSLAERFGILPSGGSDFHGAAKPKISLGTGLGSLAVPEAWAEALAEKARVSCK